MASALLSGECHWIKWLHFYLLFVLLGILHQALLQGLEIRTSKTVIFTSENGTVHIECEQLCPTSDEIHQLWRLQAPYYNNFKFRDLDPYSASKMKVETDFGIQIDQGKQDNYCAPGDMYGTFYLNITRVNASLNQAVVLCGLENASTKMTVYSHSALYIIINTTNPVVSATSVVNYATQSGVLIECTHMCSGASANWQYLWTVRAFKYSELGALELHDNQVRERVEEDLGIEIRLTADADSCSDDGVTSFYLNIVGMSESLQHAAVSCGVKTRQDSSEVYSDEVSYIVINETEVVASRRIYYANDSGVTIQCAHSCNEATNPQYLWTIQMAEQLQPQELHDNSIRIQTQRDLGISIRIDPETTYCEEGDSMKTFNLVISRMNDRLQHAKVSCGVKLSQNSSEVYSSCDSYIVIEQNAATTTPPLVTTSEENEDAATTMPSLTMPSEETTMESNTSVPAPSNLPSAAFAAAVAVPSGVIGFLIGAATVIVLLGLFFLLKKGKSKQMEENPGCRNAGYEQELNPGCRNAGYEQEFEKETSVAI